MKAVNAPNVSSILSGLFPALSSDISSGSVDIYISVCQKCGKIEFFAEPKSFNYMNLTAFDSPGQERIYDLGLQNFPLKDDIKN